MINDVLMPPMGLALGKVDFKDLFVSLNGQTYASLAAAKSAGAPGRSERNPIAVIRSCGAA